MKRFLLALVTVLLASSTVATAQPSLETKVTGCAAGGSKGSETKRSRSKSEEAEIVAGTDWFTFTATEDHVCCLKVDVTHHIERDQITITESWHGEMCRCMCSSEIKATVSGLPPGRYTVTVLRRDRSDSPNPPEAIVRHKQELIVAAQ